MLLARLLVPSDFGLVAMAMTVLGPARVVAEAGLTAAAVQQKRLDTTLASLLFWINLALATALAFLLALAAEPIARLYGEPDVAHLILLLAPVMLLDALGAQHRALLQRAMLWGRLQRTDLVAQGAGAAVAVLLASLLNLGALAIVAQLWAVSLLTSTLLWQASGWRPGRPARHSVSRNALRYGGALTGFQLVNFATRNSDDALIGWYWGAVDLGLYDRGYRIATLMQQSIREAVSGPVIAALSRLQSDDRAWRSMMLQQLSRANLMLLPGAVFLASASQDLVMLVLGSGWQRAADVIYYLGPALVLGAVQVANGWIYLSLGTTGRQLRWNLLVAMPVSLAAFVFTLPWGAEAVALGFSGAMALLTVPSVIFATRGTAVAATDILWRTLPQAGAGLGLLAVLPPLAEAMTSGPAGRMTIVLTGTAALTALLTLGLYARMPWLAQVRAACKTMLGPVR